MRILVIDDNRIYRKMAKYILSTEGHRVFLAAGAEEGLTMAETKNPDLILLDIMMPGTNGYEVCAQLKNDPKTKNIPVFILTAKEQIKDIENAFRAGADDYITKSVAKKFGLGDVILGKLLNLEDKRKETSKSTIKSKTT
ncbi:MAG: response regulator [bacterium]